MLFFALPLSVLLLSSFLIPKPFLQDTESTSEQLLEEKQPEPPKLDPLENLALVDLTSKHIYFFDEIQHSNCLIPFKQKILTKMTYHLVKVSKTKVDSNRELSVHQIAQAHIRKIQNSKIQKNKETNRNNRISSSKDRSSSIEKDGTEKHGSSDFNSNVQPTTRSGRSQLSSRSSTRSTSDGSKEGRNSKTLAEDFNFDHIKISYLEKNEENKPIYEVHIEPLFLLRLIF